MRLLLPRLLRLSLAAGFLLLAWWTLRSGYADRLYRQDTAQSVAEAVELESGNSDYHRRLSELDPALRRTELEAAIQANPRDSDARIQLGLLAESEGDLAAAEQQLLEAARIDNTHDPAWTLTGFYFRTQNENEFWRWARHAEQMSYENNTALYRLCWQMSGDPDLILERAIPPEPEHLARYLIFLIEDKHVDAGIEVASRLMEAGADSYRGVVIGLDEQLLIERNVDGAFDVWNELASHGWIAYPAFDAANAHSVTNSDFAQQPLERGFDWRPLGCDGVSVAATPGAVRIEMSGTQAAACELLMQYLPLEENASYRLEAEWDGDAPAGTGWQAADAVSGERWPITGGEFSTGDQTRLARLTLRYDRRPGEPAASGVSRITRVSLTRVR